MPKYMKNWSLAWLAVLGCAGCSTTPDTAYLRDPLLQPQPVVVVAPAPTLLVPPPAPAPPTRVFMDPLPPPPPILHATPVEPVMGQDNAVDQAETKAKAEAKPRHERRPREHAVYGGTRTKTKNTRPNGQTNSF